MYYLTYPFKKMSISQNYNQGNHKTHWSGSKNYKDYPIDESCGGSGKDPVYAPVDVKVVKIYGLNTTKTTNAIVVETVEKVRTPIGDYKVYITFTHSSDSDLKKLKVGQIIKKGKIICYEGTDGYATGNHIHLTAGIAPYKGLYENTNGKWCFTGEASKKPEQLFYVNTKFTKIINKRSLDFKTITTDKVEVKKTTVKTTTSSNFLPKRGYFRLGDVSKNVGKIASFMYKTFPAYTKKSALGNLYGINLRNSIKEFQRRTKLNPTGNVDSSTLKKLEKYGFKY